MLSSQALQSPRPLGFEGLASTGNDAVKHSAYCLLRMLSNQITVYFTLAFVAVIMILVELIGIVRGGGRQLRAKGMVVSYSVFKW